MKSLLLQLNWKLSETFIIWRLQVMHVLHCKRHIWLPSVQRCQGIKVWGWYLFPVFYFPFHLHPVMRKNFKSCVYLLCAVGLRLEEVADIWCDVSVKWPTSGSFSTRLRGSRAHLAQDAVFFIVKWRWTQLQPRKMKTSLRFFVSFFCWHLFQLKKNASLSSAAYEKPKFPSQHMVHVFVFLLAYL